MSIPDYLPTLAAGPHPEGSGQACVMEYVSMLAGEQWSDKPTCTHPILALMARGINDMLENSIRTKLMVPLIGRLFGTASDEGEGAGFYSGLTSVTKLFHVRTGEYSSRVAADLNFKLSQKRFEAHLWKNSDFWYPKAYASPFPGFPSVVYDTPEGNEAIYTGQEINASKLIGQLESVPLMAADHSCWYGLVFEIEAKFGLPGSLTSIWRGSAAKYATDRLTAMLDDYDRFTGRKAEPLSEETLAGLKYKVEVRA